MTSKIKPTTKAAEKKVPAKVPKKTSEKKSTVKAEESKKTKLSKPHLVRDSFTIPESEYAALAMVKKACLEAGFDIKKSELIRIGIALIGSMSTSKVKSAKKKLQTVKTGRPKKHK